MPDEITKFVCSMCGVEVEADAPRNPETDDEFLCEDCLHSHFFICGCCREWVSKDGANTIHRRGGSETMEVCNSCYDQYSTCYQCGDTYHADWMTSIRSHMYCEHCRNEHFSECASCGTWISNDDANHVDGDVLCDSCYEDHSGGGFESVDANGHSYKPRPLFYYVDSDLVVPQNRRRYFGVELEVEFCAIGAGRAAESAAEEVGRFVYLKEDGSLSNGVEFVTHPFTMNYLKENPHKFDPILGLSRRGCKSFNTNTCGMHIHVSKCSVTCLTLYKVMKLFYENPTFVYDASHRKRLSDIETWARIHHDPEDGTQVYVAKNKKRWENRYRAINLLPDHTIEFRIFKGTLNKTSFFANIQWVSDILDYCEDESIARVSPIRFKEWQNAQAARARKAQELKDAASIGY